MAKPNMGSEGVDWEIVGNGSATGDAWSSKLFGIPFRTLLWREVNRFLKVWPQTLFAPLLNSTLYVVVFGYGLGS